MSWKNQLFPLDVPSNQSIEHNTPASASSMRLEAAAFLAQLADSAIYVYLCWGIFFHKVESESPQLSMEKLCIKM